MRVRTRLLAIGWVLLASLASSGVLAYFEASFPDLAGSWSGVVAAAGVVSGTLTVENQGMGKSKSAPISLYLSSDATLDPGDTRLPARLKVGGLAPGAERAVRVAVEVAGAVSGLYLIAVIDPEKSLDDLDRSDNTVAAQIP
jgi:hypothetical protein